MYGAIAHTVIWRGSRREVDVVFGNVRDASWLTDDHFRARPGTWRIVIDHPFDQPGHSGTEDLARLDHMVESGLQSRTIAWLPRFLSDERMTDVRRLVVLDWLLGGAGERWTGYADHLSEVDRMQARAILESQRTGAARGPAPGDPGVLRRRCTDAGHARARRAGRPDPGQPGSELLPGHARSERTSAAAFGNLVDQAFSATYPGHPRFEPGDVEVTVRDLAAVYAHVQRAVADPDGRVRLEGDIAGVRRVATALGVGSAGETHFLFGDDRFSPWGNEFERAASREGLQPQDPVRAGQVRDWIDAMVPRLGLRDEVADLIVLAWAALRQRAWYQHGSAIPAPKPGSARPEMELRPEPLPAPADWQTAATRAEQIFGIHVNPFLTAAGVAELAGKLGDEATARADIVSTLASRVEVAYDHLGLSRERPVRQAQHGTGLRGADRVPAPRAGPGRPGDAHWPGPPCRPRRRPWRSRSAQATNVSQALHAFHWDRLAPLTAAAQRGRRARQSGRQDSGGAPRRL